MKEERRARKIHYRLSRGPSLPPAPLPLYSSGTRGVPLGVASKSTSVYTHTHTHTHIDIVIKATGKDTFWRKRRASGITTSKEYISMKGRATAALAWALTSCTTFLWIRKRGASICPLRSSLPHNTKDKSFRHMNI